MNHQHPHTADYPDLALHIDGEWIARGDRNVHQVVNPATGEVIGELPLAGEADLDRALDAADRAFREWRTASADQKGAVLKGAARLVRERADRIARIATLEEGKTLAEAKGETLASANLLEWMGEEARRIYGRVLVRPTGRRSLVTHEPVGPVAAFAPWNFPVLNPTRKIAPAVAAGCSVILKPAEESPGSAIEIVRALVESGLPAGVVQLVFGVPDEVSRRLLASPVTRKLTFTGSVPVGKHLMRLAADTMMRTTMELGGHAPVIVFDDCDLDRTVDMLAVAKCRNSGQVCVSPTRFYVQQGIYDRFVDGLQKRLEGVALGDGLLEGSQMGPLANPRRPEAMETLVRDAVEQGATLRTGGDRHGEAGFFFRPTLLSDVPLSARIMNEEPFGPVIVARPFATMDEVVEEANRLPFGLAGYAFTENGRTANLIADALEVGMVGINSVMMSAADSPFGGVKESGHGSEDGPEGLAAFLVTKAIHQA